MKKVLACILACLMTTAFFGACNNKDGGAPGLWEDSSTKGGVTTKPPAEDDDNWTGFY